MSSLSVQTFLFIATLPPYGVKKNYTVNVWMCIHIMLLIKVKYKLWFNLRGSSWTGEATVFTSDERKDEWLHSKCPPTRLPVTHWDFHRSSFVKQTAAVICFPKLNFKLQYYVCKAEMSLFLDFYALGNSVAYSCSVAYAKRKYANE